MKLVVGLGNPGEEYVGTRHNVGFEALERLAGEVGMMFGKKSFSSLWTKEKIEGRDVAFQLPQTFMNLSGDAVAELCGFFRIAPADVLVVHDDLDLDLGRIKSGFDSGAAGHRGVTSITERLGTKAYHRLKLGIGRPERKAQVQDFVLSRFSKDERAAVETMMGEAVKKISEWIRV